MRDRLHLVTRDKQYQIDYQSYLPVLDLESLVQSSQSAADLEAAKSIIMTYIFSLKKENRGLHRRLNDRNF